MPRAPDPPGRFVALPSGPVFVREWGERGRRPFLYWDGLGGCSLHANELAPLLVEQHELRVVALDPPGHGRTPRLEPSAYRRSALARLAADLLTALSIEDVVFVGFSWGADVGCSFAAAFPGRTAALVLVDGGYWDWPDMPSVDLDASLESCVAGARRRAAKERYEDWESYLAAEAEALRRWTPALAEAHRAMMREEHAAIVPILAPDDLGAIKYWALQEPLAATYPRIAAAGVPTLLLRAPVHGSAAAGGLVRFRDALPRAAVVEAAAEAVHDLVSHDPDWLAAQIGRWLDG